MGVEEMGQFALPPEDGALVDALATLDRKIAEYAAAVRQIATRLHGPAQEPPQEVTQVTVDLTDEPVVSCEQRKHVASRLTERATDNPQSLPHSAQTLDLTQKLTPEAAPDATPLKPVRSVEYKTTAATPAEPGDANPIADAAAGTSPALTGDEALLAAVDEATAKAVRVLHRLNPRKTVQELIEHVKAHPPEQHLKSAAKSWFRFGR